MTTRSSWPTSRTKSARASQATSVQVATRAYHHRSQPPFLCGLRAQRQPLQGPSFDPSAPEAARAQPPQCEMLSLSRHVTPSRVTTAQPRHERSVPVAEEVGRILRMRPYNRSGSARWWVQSAVPDACDGAKSPTRSPVAQLQLRRLVLAKAVTIGAARFDWWQKRPEESRQCTWKCNRRAAVELT
jgi:hypothetical protein